MLHVIFCAPADPASPSIRDLSVDPRCTSQSTVTLLAALRIRRFRFLLPGNHALRWINPNRWIHQPGSYARPHGRALGSLPPLILDTPRLLRRFQCTGSPRAQSARDSPRLRLSLPLLVTVAASRHFYLDARTTQRCGGHWPTVCGRGQAPRLPAFPLACFAATCPRLGDQCCDAVCPSGAVPTAQSPAPISISRAPKSLAAPVSPDTGPVMQHNVPAMLRLLHNITYPNATLTSTSPSSSAAEAVRTITSLRRLARKHLMYDGCRRGVDGMQCLPLTVPCCSPCPCIPFGVCGWCRHSRCLPPFLFCLWLSSL
ncbi:hypothetical protein DFH09DRAFT_1165792, partial [Mycena vulgaris]